MISKERQTRDRRCSQRGFFFFFFQGYLEVRFKFCQLADISSTSQNVDVVLGVGLS